MLIDCRQPALCRLIFFYRTEYNRIPCVLMHRFNLLIFETLFSTSYCRTVLPQSCSCKIL
uniref:Uncharacterized protein n=1 Tax=Anguilla anguilla TaxID=7936 RepID=A0A0E9TE98_ANGAN